MQRLTKLSLVCAAALAACPSSSSCMRADRADQKGGKKEKYFCTFPYPVRGLAPLVLTVSAQYMNGVLHLGHAFTLTKAEFQARYQVSKPPLEE